MAKRSKKKWDNNFLIAQDLFASVEKFEKMGRYDLVKESCIAYRNPIVFDNDVKDANFSLPFYIKGNNEKMTEDHLIGMSNIVLYMYKRGLNKNWKTSNDFIKSLKALSVLLNIPKSLNNKGSYKNWQFDFYNIEECIYWNKKLKREGIEFLTSENDKFETPVDEVWEEWYNMFKSDL